MPAQTVEVPILIVGGGVSGVTSSLALTQLGVDHLLIERRPGLGRLPKAQLLNQRTMEIFRQLGLDKDLLDHPESTHGEELQYIAWHTSLGGDDPEDGRMFVKLPAWGGGVNAGRVYQQSPSVHCSFHQVNLEPYLVAHMKDVSAREPWFGFEAVDIMPAEDHVEVLVRNVETDEQILVRAQYVIGADGGRKVGPSVGIEFSGLRNLMDNVSVYFKADLKDMVDRAAVLNWFVNPGTSDSFAIGSGVLVPVGHLNRDRQHWCIHFGEPPSDNNQDPEDVLVGRIRELLKLPDLEIEVESVSHWLVEGIVADRYREGRVFVVGDAAHRHPPTVGIGMNSAVADVHNLVWKLAMVVKGIAGPSLLETYETERQSVAAQNVDCATTTYFTHMMVNILTGMLPGTALEDRKRGFAEFFSDTAEGQRRRNRAEAVMRYLFQMEFEVSDIEMGYIYDEGAVVTDPTAPAPIRDPLNVEYHQTTIPGARLPHVWLENADHEQISTHDLGGGLATFVLLVSDSEASSAWVEAAATAQRRTNVPVKVVRIGSNGDFTDPSDNWAELRGVNRDGAVLVRPDNHVAWRIADAPSEPADVLTEVLGHVVRAQLALA